jgi:D-alanyl-D-alanine carboxypeptidase
VRSGHRRWFAVVLLVVAVPLVSYTQEERRIEAARSARLDSGATLSSAPRILVPGVRTSILPDDQGRLAFDPALAYSLQRALDSVRTAQGIKGGISAGVLVPGQGVWLGVAGYSSTNPTVPIDPAMLFGVGSNSKAFISTTILSLVDEGKVGLDDPLSKYLPTLTNITMSVTIRQLLNMTSGLFDYLNDSNAQGEAVAADPNRYWTPEELIATFVGPRKALPGSAYSYCNTNYVLLGMVIKAVTGQSMSSQLRQRVLTPLALDHTYLESEESHTESIAHPWDSGYDFMSTPVTAHFTTLWTAGGIISTGENMARWVKGLHEGAVITPSTLTQMLTYVPTATAPSAGFGWYGYGLGVRQGAYYTKPVRGHVGAIMGYISITGYLPATGASFAVLFNASEATTTIAITSLMDAYLRKVTPPHARGGVCYALSGVADSCRSYTVDTLTAALSPVGAAHYGSLIGAKVDPLSTRLYGIASAIGWELVQLDGETGEAYPRVRIKFPAGSPTDFKGLDFHANGTLYVGSVDGRIYTIDLKTGVATLALTTRIPIFGLAFDPLTGELWATPRLSATLRDRVYRIDLATGDTIGVGNTGFNQPLVDIAFDARARLFGLVGNPSSGLKYRLALIDKATAVGREIGSTGLAGVMSIAFSPLAVLSAVGEPSSSGVPDQLLLGQNYPNPFNPSTHIGFTVPGNSSMQVRLTVYDMLGKQVATLADGMFAPGSYTRIFDAHGLASGVYVYRLQLNGAETGQRSIIRTQKALLLR